ncbi:hypothetical protein EDB80DRAFT_24193 [Ilyonectria destructans]|nr:hypothetical protein EDB80DRAFT_24193 [Ilyonectria destructans]
MPRNLFIAKRYSYIVSCVLMASGRPLDTRTLEDPRCYNWVGTLPEVGDLSRIQGRCDHGRRQIGQGGDAPESCKKAIDAPGAMIPFPKAGDACEIMQDIQLSGHVFAVNRAADGWATGHSDDNHQQRQRAMEASTRDKYGMATSVMCALTTAEKRRHRAR